jgi:ketosteroid isomerase-like protein
MTTTLPKIAADYIRATNNHDSAAFIACFAESAVVVDGGREFRGIDAIKAWSDHEIMDTQVTLEVLEVADHDGEVTITTKVDGNFDRTGLPDPVIIDHNIEVDGDKIIVLTCRLAD